VPTVTVPTYPNQDAFKKSCYALQRTIKQAKRQYRTKIESYYTGSDARRIWQGLQTITDYKGKHRRELPSETSQPDELNNFYARFEARHVHMLTKWQVSSLTFSTCP
jgi:hypothetical protein